MTKIFALFCNAEEDFKKHKNKTEMISSVGYIHFLLFVFSVYVYVWVLFASEWLFVCLNPFTCCCVHISASVFV